MEAEAKLLYASLFKIDGTGISTVDVTNIVVNDSSTIGDATVLDQLGAVTTKTTVDGITITSASFSGTLGTQAFFKFTGSSPTVEVKNIDLINVPSTGALTMALFENNAYDNVSISAWTLNNVQYS